MLNSPAAPRQTTGRQRRSPRLHRPKESATWALLPEQFCFEADFLTDATTTARQVLTCRSSHPLHAPSAENSASDPSLPSTLQRRTHSEFAIFAQQYEQPKATGLQQMLRPRPSVSSIGRTGHCTNRRPLAPIKSWPLAVAQLPPPAEASDRRVCRMSSARRLTCQCWVAGHFQVQHLLLRPDDPLRAVPSLRFASTRSKAIIWSSGTSRAVSAARLAERGAPLTITGGPHTRAEG